MSKKLLVAHSYATAYYKQCCYSSKEVTSAVSFVIKSSISSLVMFRAVGTWYTLVRQDWNCDKPEKAAESSAVIARPRKGLTWARNDSSYTGATSQKLAAKVLVCTPSTMISCPVWSLNHDTADYVHKIEGMVPASLSDRFIPYYGEQDGSISHD